MSPFPLNLSEIFQPIGIYLIYALIGFAFGYTLEIAGFGNSRKLAAQFYLGEMTVLKVMFTAIVVAMVLLYGASALGWLDINLIWINPTYLWPGILGGLIMGVGFIVGGFCPGTSIVAMATLKVDGALFALGTLFGIFLFGESVDSFSIFWNSSYAGRLTLQQVFGVDAGVVVLVVVLMALFMFWGAEQLEKKFGGKDPRKEPRLRYIGAGLLVLGAFAVLVIGQPTNEDRWQQITAEKEALLEARAVQIEPAELLHTMHDHQIRLVLLDVRSEADFNLFHIADARNVAPEELLDLVPELHLETTNTVFVVMSNDETAATAAWKVLVAESLPNVYILEGGINRWIDTYAGDDQRLRPIEVSGDDVLRYEFVDALGAAYRASDPDPHEYEQEFEPKIKLEIKRGPMGGGCG